MVKGAMSRRKMMAAAGGLAGLATLPASAAGGKERLQITRIELFKVVVPMQEDINSSPEMSGDDLSEFPKTPKFITKLYTDSGIVGIGESHRGIDVVLLRRAIDQLVGKNILDLNLTNLDLDPRVYCAFEIAMYDALGKAIGWPVYRLLGGLAQPKVLVNYWCARKNPIDIKRVAQRALAGHFTTIKIKGYPGDPIVRSVESIRSVAPDIKVILDTEGHFKSAEEFLPVGLGLDAVGNMEVIEDPVAHSNMAGFVELKNQLQTRLALHSGVPDMLIRFIRADAVQVFNMNPNPSMFSFVENCYLTGAAKKPVWHGSGHELDILDASMVHSIAASPNCTLPSDILSYQRVHSLLVKPLSIHDSYATVPVGPGLGVELDEDAVHRFQVA